MKQKETKGTKRAKCYYYLVRLARVASRLSRVVIRVVLSQKSIFYFFNNLRAFHEIFSGKVYFVNYIIPVLN